MMLPLALLAAISTAGPFAFYSNFWINLHHFLDEQAQHSSTAAVAALPPGELAAWEAALQMYRQSFVKKDWLFDANLRAIEVELIEDETLPQLPLSGTNAALWQTLNAVGPIYREHWWALHDRANRAWIAAVVPLAQQFSPQLMKQLAAAYETPFPAQPIRVDVAEYANWAGAYTFTYGFGKVREIFSSSDLAAQGDASLELLFHEASHGMNIQIPPSRQHDLLHIVIFYTAGEWTRRDLEAAGVKGYVPYADKNRLYRADWAPWRQRLGAEWGKHLDGTESLAQAMERILRAP